MSCYRRGHEAYQTRGCCQNCLSSTSRRVDMKDYRSNDTKRSPDSVKCPSSEREVLLPTAALHNDIGLYRASYGRRPNRIAGLTRWRTSSSELSASS